MEHQLPTDLGGAREKRSEGGELATMSFWQSTENDLHRFHHRRAGLSLLHRERKGMKVSSERADIDEGYN
jgi:hypothetical protein